MQLPARFVYAVRPHAAPGILAASAASAAAFAATPFVLAGVADRFHVSVGTAGAVSTAQVGAMAVTSLIAPRRLRPTTAVLRCATVLMAAAGAGSSLAPAFGPLVAARAVSGVGIGLATWVAWADAAGHPRRTADVAATGPLVAAAGSPALAWLAGRGGDRPVWWALAAVSLAASVVPARIRARPPGRHRRRPSLTNPLLVVALGILTLSGSSLFVFAGTATVSRTGADPVVVSWAYSANALAGVAATRIRPGPLGAGGWLGMTAVAAAVLAPVPSVAVYTAAMTVWGFAFWVGVPRVFGLLAERSHVPDERVGDAQALMALGRAVGPLVGGALVGDGRFVLLGVAASTGLLTAAGLVTLVEVARRRHPLPAPGTPPEE